jgi:hypothetical protein
MTNKKCYLTATWITIASPFLAATANLSRSVMPQSDDWLRQSSIPRFQSDRNRPFVLDKERRNFRLKCLLDAVASSLAGFNRLVDRHAEFGRGLDQLSVLRADGGQAGLMPVHQPSLDQNLLFLAGHRNRLVDPRLATMDDHQFRTVPSEQTVHNLPGQLRAVPMSIAYDQDTHVQIVISEKSAKQVLIAGLSRLRRARSWQW